MRAIVNIRKICEEHLQGRYELEVVDISQHPTLAEGEQIIAAPTLIKKLPLPLRRFIGDMSQTERILLGLDLRREGEQVCAEMPGRSRPPLASKALLAENAELRARLEEAEEMLRAHSRAARWMRSSSRARPARRFSRLQGMDAESNRFRGEILAQVTDAVVAIDFQQRITYVNAAAERQYGIPASEVLGRELGEFYHFRWIRPEDEAAASSALRERGEWRGENIHITRDGRELHVESSVTTMRDRDGAAIGLLAAIRDVTARKRAEDALLAREESFLVMANAIIQLAWIARPDGHIIWYNERWYNYTGTTPEQMEGWGWQSVHHPAELQKVLHRWKNCIATAEPFEMTFPLRGADGNFRQFLTRAIPLKNEKGQVVQWFGTNTDVDEITRAETALRESNQRMLLATEATGVGIWEWNVVTGALRWDAQMFRIYGIAPTNDGMVSYSMWSGSVLPEDLPRQEMLLQESVQGIGNRTREFRIRRANDGECRRIQAVETVRTNDDGRVEWVVGTNLDVTERQQADDLIMEQDGLLELIATGSPLDECLTALCSATFRVNPRTRACIFIADAERKLFSHSIAPDLAADFAAGIAKAPIEEVGGGVCAAAALTGLAVTCPDIAADPRWSPAWKALCLSHGVRACHSAPVLDSEGHALAVLTLYFDEPRVPGEWELGISDFGTHLASIVFERDRADAAVRAALAAAEAASRSKDHFLAVLSHELRTPLTPVLMAVAALERDSELRSDVREDLAMMKRNIELETKLIDDLLDLSRITSGKLPLNLESVDFNDAVRRVCAICRPASGGPRLEYHFGEEVGSVRADPTRLQQVLWNVIRNAFKFTPEGGSVILTTKRLPTDRCEIRVRDSGIGIPPDALPRIFHAFDQGAEGVTRRFGGLGLGLAISRAIVELHGGSIRAESPGEGLGATFIIELPAESAAAATPSPGPTPAADRQTQTLRLLLVEDHADTARTLSRLLRRAGFEVINASDVLSATAIAEREPFDLLVSDLGLPDGSGCDVMKRVREKCGAPGIAMSGYGMTEDLNRSREAGFSEHLIKPINVQELIAAIWRARDAHKSQARRLKPGG